MTQHKAQFQSRTMANERPQYSAQFNPSQAQQHTHRYARAGSSSRRNNNDSHVQEGAKEAEENETVPLLGRGTHAATAQRPRHQQQQMQQHRVHHPAQHHAPVRVTVGSGGGDSANQVVRAAGVPSKAEIDALYEENTNIWKRERVLIPMFYLLLGFCISFPFVAQRQYLRNALHMNPGGQGAVLGVLIQFPWFVKLLFAFISDSAPVCGLRRKPYCIVGVLLCGISWILLGLVPQNSTVLFCTLSALATLGLVVADVMVDTLVVFIVREYEQLRSDKLGSLQTTAVSLADAVLPLVWVGALCPPSPHCLLSLCLWHLGHSVDSSLCWIHCGHDWRWTLARTRPCGVPDNILADGRRLSGLPGATPVAISRNPVEGRDQPKGSAFDHMAVSIALGPRWPSTYTRCTQCLRLESLKVD